MCAGWPAKGATHGFRQDFTTAPLAGKRGVNAWQRVRRAPFGLISPRWLRSCRDHGGAAVLLVSEDLDELLELSDRLVVMFHGRLVHEARASEADLTEIGRHMAGH
jgi:hypothetical protein